MDEKELNALMDQAAKKVAEQLGSWTSKNINIISNKIEVIEIDDLSKVLLSYGDPFIIYSSLDGGKIKGISLTLLEKKEAMLLASILTGTASVSKFLNEQEHSALRETSNVVSGAYVNVLANGIGKVITSTQPLIVNKDDLDDLEKDLAGIENKKTKVMLLSSKFGINKQNINIVLFIFFNKEFNNNYPPKKR